MQYMHLFCIRSAFVLHLFCICSVFVFSNLWWLTCAYLRYSMFTWLDRHLTSPYTPTLHPR